MSVQGMQGLPARIVKLTKRIYAFSKNVNKSCKKCTKGFDFNTDIVTKHSHKTNRLPRKSSTHWYHVECAKALNII